MKPRSHAVAVVLGCGLVIGTPAAAQTVPEPMAVAILAQSDVAVAVDTPAELPVPSPFTGAVAVEDSTLQGISGRAEIQQTVIASNSSNVSGNSVNGQSVTGTISIDGQALQNMNGLSVLTANTGNNVSINASMNVNVAIQQ